MIGFKLSDIKKTFVDRAAVTRAVDTAALQVMARFGAFVRRTAKGSIRRAGKKRKSSRPGQPPKSHTGDLKNNIFFGIERDRVIIGPARLNKPGRALEALEYGGPATLTNGKRITIAARPFMRPALDKEQHKAAALWRNAIKR